LHPTRNRSAHQSVPFDLASFAHKADVIGILRHSSVFSDGSGYLPPMIGPMKKYMQQYIPHGRAELNAFAVSIRDFFAEFVFRERIEKSRITGPVFVG
jgi:hypothetical protein